MASPSIWERPESQGLSGLLSGVRELELLSRRRAYSLLQGSYRTGVKGRGLEFREARKYVFGESVRRIDWNITARMNEPYVREYEEERQREIFLVLDVSPSMHQGWQDRKKIEFAVELAASAAFSAVDSGDRLGFITYSDRVKESFFPAQGMRAFYHTVSTFYREAVEGPEETEFSDMRQAVHALQKLRGKRFMVLFFSDFMEHDIPDDLRYLSEVHDIVLVHIYDPLEYAENTSLSLISSSPEGMKKRALRVPGKDGELAVKERMIRMSAGSMGMSFCSFSTARTVEECLRRLFV